MKKKMIRGAVTALVGVILVAVGAFLALQSFGTAMLGGSGSRLGLVFFCAAPVLLLVGMIMFLSGTGKAVRCYKMLPKEKNEKIAAQPKAKEQSRAAAPKDAPGKTSIVFCGKCGARNTTTDVFCCKCGERMI